MDAMRERWAGAGLENVETREIVVQRTYASFDDFWVINAKSPSMSGLIAAMSPGDVETLKSRVRARLPQDAEGRITYSARAHAVKARVPG